MRKVLWTLVFVGALMLTCCDIYINGQRVYRSPLGQIADYLKARREAGSQ
jgi:hypothetical protein